jgi:predicted HTH transcriptional regulator
MTDADLFELIRSGERPGVEFKNARARQDKSFVEVARAVLGMANRRNGGTVLIGVEDNGNATGLSTDQAASWATSDHVRQAMAGFADPYVYLDVSLVKVDAELLKGRIFAAIAVHEFDEVPVLCARDGKDAKGNVVLAKGALYIRTNHMPATTQVADHAQFREVLDIAIDKGVRNFLKRAAATGLGVTGQAPPTDDDRYAAQRAKVDE